MIENRNPIDHDDSADGFQGDVESSELAHSHEFWQMIEQRRQEPTIPWEQAKRELAN